MLAAPIGQEFFCAENQSIPPSQRLHLILLGVENIARSKAFYEALGWSKSETGHDEFVKFNLGGYALCLLERKALAIDARLEQSPVAPFNGVCFVHLAQRPEEVAAILAKAVQAGGTLVKTATRTPYGIAGYFKDPDGYLFEVDYEEVFVFDESGGLVVDVMNDRTC